MGGNDSIFGGDGADYIEGGTGNDYLEGGTGNDTLHGGADTDKLLGGADTDTLYGDAGADTLLGGDDDATDILVGGSGEDVLMGQGGVDILVGGNSLEDMYSEKVSDYLNGGSGYDTYYVSHTDIIDDADGSGLIMFNDKATNGKKRKVDEYIYEDDNFTYTIDGANLIVVDKMLGEYITILNFHDGKMGIDFSEDKKDKEIIITAEKGSRIEMDGQIAFDVHISQALDEEISIGYEATSDGNSLVAGTYTVVIPKGETTGMLLVDIIDDTIAEDDENITLSYVGFGYNGSDIKSVKGKDGSGVIIDDDAKKEPLQVEVSSQSINEANTTMTFTVSLKGVLEDGESLTVNFATADASATGGVDYGNVAKSVTFTNDSLTQTIEVPIYDDPYKESDETFWLTPVSASGYNGDKEIVFKNAGEGTIIDNDDNGQVVIEVGSTSADEGDTGIQSTNVTVSISSKLSQDLIVDLSSGDSVTIPTGSTSTTAKVTWGADIVDTVVDSDSPIDVSITDFTYFGNEDVVSGHSGKVTIVDDDNGDGHGFDDKNFTPPRRDPLVLDTDKDGFISTVSLENSNAYFDITGDGIKERVGWIESNDGILVYDKNNNGSIDGINEVFGNSNTSGFEELREVADSNYDNKIDRRDELYNRLQVWHDNNGNGTVEQGELKSLKDEGIKNIELDVVGTNINIDGNLLAEAGRYQDSQGSRELAADVQLAFDSRITAIDIASIDDYTKKPQAETLPNLRGYGVVGDSAVLYNGKYHSLITHHYENFNKQYIMTDILKKVA